MPLSRLAFSIISPGQQTPIPGLLDDCARQACKLREDPVATVLDRYRAGEYEQVWAELCAFGAAVRREPLLTEAMEVARETMQRARANIELLVPRLKDTGYQVGGPYAPATAWSPPRPHASERIGALERLVGPIPLSLRAWYEVGGSVSFVGSHSDWRWVGREILPGLVALPDPLVIYPVERALADCEERLSDEGWDRSWQNYVPIAPDEYHKENISGGPVYAIGVPNAAADAPLMYEWHHTTFVNYLRLCFRWGGFPGFERYQERPTEMLDYLAEGLLPL